MEIRNNPAVNTTTFGMAMRKPANIEHFVEDIGIGKGTLNSKLKQRAFAKLKKELADCTHYDVEHRRGDRPYFAVVENATNTTVERCYDSPETNALYETLIEKVLRKAKPHEEVRGLKQIPLFLKDITQLAVATIRTILNPVHTLPKNLRHAADTSKRLEKEALALEKRQAIKAKAVQATERLFDEEASYQTALGKIKVKK